MSFADELSQAPPRGRSAQPCGVKKFLELLDEETAKVVRERCDEWLQGVRTWGHTQLYRKALEAFPDIAPPRSSWSAHRRGDCSCV